MKSIFEISQEYLQLSEALVESGGEVTPEMETALTVNKEELQLKGVNYAYVVKQIEGDIVLIDAEIKRLSNLKQYRENAVERLKKVLAGAMQLHGIEEIKTPTIKINFRKSKAVEISDTKWIPAEYMVEKTTTSPDKKALKEAIEGGERIQGVSIVEHQNLQIK